MDAVELRVTDLATGHAVDGLQIAATPWMPSMGHGASVVPTVTPRGAGVYDLADVDFFMPGSWELRLTLHGTLDDTATITFDVQ